MSYQLLTQEDFPESNFFTYLKKGVEYYQDGDFQRAIWEWFAASRFDITGTIEIKKDNDPAQLKCNFKNVSFLHFMYAIYLNGLTGIAQLENADKNQTIKYKKGFLCNMENFNPKKRIGKYIIQKRKDISHEQVKKSIIESKKRNIRTGQCMLENNMLTDQELEDILNQQIIESVGEILSRQEGEIYFTQKEVNEKLKKNHSPLKIAFKAAQKRFDVNNFRNEITDNKAIFRKSPHLDELEKKLRDKLSTNEIFLLSLIDGFRNIDQLVRFSGSNEETITSILYRLSKIGLIRKIRETAEYEDKEYEELSKTLDLILDMYTTLHSRLYRQLGRKTDTIVVKAKKRLDQDKQKLLKNVPIETPQDMQQRTILNNMAHYYPEPEKRVVFIEIFGELFESLLDETQRYLGDKITQTLMQDIKTTASNIESLSVQTSYSTQLRNTLMHILHNHPQFKQARKGVH